MSTRRRALRFLLSLTPFPRVLTSGAFPSLLSTSLSTCTEMFASKWDRPALRVGAEGQTLPLPEMRIVNDKKMQKVDFVAATEDADDCPARAK